MILWGHLLSLLFSSWLVWEVWWVITRFKVIVSQLDSDSGHVCPVCAQHSQLSTLWCLFALSYFTRRRRLAVIWGLAASLFVDTNLFFFFLTRRMSQSVSKLGRTCRVLTHVHSDVTNGIRSFRHLKCFTPLLLNPNAGEPPGLTFEANHMPKKCQQHSFLHYFCIYRILCNIVKTSLRV